MIVVERRALCSFPNALHFEYSHRLRPNTKHQQVDQYFGVFLVSCQYKQHEAMQNKHILCNPDLSQLLHQYAFNTNKPISFNGQPFHVSVLSVSIADMNSRRKQQGVLVFKGGQLLQTFTHTCSPDQIWACSATLVPGWNTKLEALVTMAASQTNSIPFPI